MTLTLRKSAIAAIAAISLAATSAAPVQALGKNEKNFLLGAGAALLLGSLYLKNQQNQTQRGYQAPTYQQPTYQEPTRYQPTTPSYGSSLQSTAAARAFNSYSSAERRQIQSKLRAFGYYTGTVDGNFGPRTHDAVTGYAGATLGSAKLSTSAGAFEVYDSLLY